MPHLSPDTFVDLLDGTLNEAAVPHLTGCAACRQQLVDMREAWRVAREPEVPEPSPLFWDHLSERVMTAVAAEPTPASLWQRGWNWRVAGIVSAAAAIVAVAVVLRLPPRETPASEPPQLHSGQVTTAVNRDAQPGTDDPSLVFVADLASSIDWDRAEEFGLAAHGDADLAVSDMNDQERAELRRLLNEALGSANSL